ncbi:hypothetical protein [Neobacillus niacini]|uniref:hypothetical protein n=1 Tax=Neobacillus niacini TaxID=86668 RepID=UPI00203B112A|nr:hypothetical protein [Neobacillus niacini]MCM3692207.1 hypothetical protein [Neobacillus niacini]
MAQLITYKRAKKEVERLKAYIDLVENYNASTIEKQIIREYAYTNSGSEIARVFEQRGIKMNGKVITKEDVLGIIKGRPTDELHKLLKSGYMTRTKYSRKKTSKSNKEYFYS